MAIEVDAMQKLCSTTCLRFTSALYHTHKIWARAFCLSACPKRLPQRIGMHRTLLNKSLNICETKRTMFCLSFPSMDSGRTSAMWTQEMLFQYNRRSTLSNQTRPEDVSRTFFRACRHGDGRISYHLVIEHLPGRKLEINEEICALSCCGISRK